MPLEQNHLREAVLSALGAAEVPADIALGVLQILTEAGCDGLRAAPSKKASLSRYVSLGSSFKCNTFGPQGIGCCDGQTK